jgi:hypothetical protein
LKKKDYNYVITDSPPLSVIQQQKMVDFLSKANVPSKKLRGGLKTRWGSLQASKAPTFLSSSGTSS